MEFNKLRLLGFKSFVEPTEFSIERGLTGVVGPNGCGKSNLVEALRWVMGENSYKNMRASSMDDVIFSGAANRPARNMAEVALFLDNADRTAPAAFNDADELQVSRRIERESGSVYRINGKDVRAKDVQLLFADVSTGARSPSMIGQGRIGELISAKPQARRALLEEAAGISGLHSRRHEAELRLRAAETNLERLDDVIAQLESQIESLKRQARQANRYRSIAGDIRRAEATILHLRWAAARAASEEAEKALTQATMQVGETQLVQTEAAKAQAIIANKLPQLRQAEVEAAAKLQRLTIARGQLDDEAKRAEKRRNDLASRITQLKADITREEEMIAQNSDILAHLDREEAELQRETGNRGEREAETKAKLEDSTTRLQDLEADFAASTSQLAQMQAQEAQLQRTVAQSEERAAQVLAQIADVERQHGEITAQIAGQSLVQEKTAIVASLDEQLRNAQQQVSGVEAAVTAAREAAQAARGPVDENRATLNRIETEAKTLSKILNSGGRDLFPAVSEQVTVAAGYEKALGAALGDDLEVPLDASAPVHWSRTGNVPDQALPQGVESLADHVKAPEELAGRLSQIGIVNADVAENLVAHLRPGQRLVSRGGHIWRWDGFVASSDAPTAAAIRLEQKNRLAELDGEAVEAVKSLRASEQKLDSARTALAEQETTERDIRQQARDLQNRRADAQRAQIEAEREVSSLSNRQSALVEAKTRLDTTLLETRELLQNAMAEQATLPDLSALADTAETLRSKAIEMRAEVAETRAAFESLARENQMRQDRLAAIGRERSGWNDRAVNADRQIATLRERLSTTENEKTVLDEAPDDIAVRRRELMAQIEAAATDRKAAADALAAMENDQREADRLASEALRALSDAQQTKARGEEKLEATRERRKDVEGRIREALGCEPHLALKATGEDDESKLQDVEKVESRLDRLRSERERLGAVNLRAEDEQNDVIEQRDTLTSERDDLIEAIRRLRQGIQSLNKEGRERLLVAFDEVNAQFQKLFTHLFGGGTAELQLVESDDPLEAGLEILARPPGKKPQTMTLLSGGEQALTAMALIFAVFLTNPAPICVLDEVDAPLDDQNVERFCNLMDQMAAETDTRFVIITHNPITMARMNRLFGVTMAERGVSQLVSVDLETAETFQEAG